MSKTNFLYKELTSKILNSAFEVSNILGTGFLEKVYENALKVELQNRGHKVETQKKIEIVYKGNIVGVYYLDMLIDEKVIVEVKHIDKLCDVQRAQIINYLKATNLKVGLILNFGKPKLEYERLVL